MGNKKQLKTGAAVQSNIKTGSAAQSNMTDPQDLAEFTRIETKKGKRRNSTSGKSDNKALGN
jgi:hypothetical protein